MFLIDLRQENTKTASMNIRKTFVKSLVEPSTVPYIEMFKILKSKIELRTRNKSVIVDVILSNVYQ
jgi:hypothetical protein